MYTKGITHRRCEVELDSKTFTERDAWLAVDKSIQSLCLDSALTEKVYSIILYGSLVRGDFLPQVSDIDIMIVMKMKDGIFPEREARQIIRVFEEESKPYRTPPPRGRHHGQAVFDAIAFGEPELPLRGRTPVPTNSILAPPEIKPLGIYAFDFERFNRILHGHNFIPAMEVRSPRSFIPERARWMRDRLRQFFKEQPSFVPVTTGEALRLARIQFGEPNLDKRTALADFMENVPDFASKSFAKTFWQQYLDVAYFEDKTDDQVQGFYDDCLRFANDIIGLLLDENPLGRTTKG